jgi:membrane associated rhomboid family serine protease
MIPYNTDAPLYHPPIATIALIALNTLLFLAVPSSMTKLVQTPSEVAGEWLQEADFGEPVEPAQDAWGEGDFKIVDEPPDPAVANGNLKEPPVEAVDPSSEKSFQLTLSLQYGAGLKPWQWLSNIFMHQDFFHLLFNMIALWAFGLVVEGKVGALVFLAIYLGIGVMQSGLEQTLMLFAEAGGSLGASAAIFGILGIAIVWAPKNDFDVLWSFGFHAGSIEVPILMYGFLQLALESVSVVLGRYQMSSGVMHLMGLALGMGIGFVWLRRRWVDCEGWDLITVLQGKEASIEPDHQLDAEARELVRTSTAGRPTRQTSRRAPDSPQASDANKKPQPLTTNYRRKPTATANSSKLSGASAAQSIDDVEQLIAAGNIVVALKLLAKLKVGDRAPQLSQAAHHNLVKGMLAGKHFSAAIPYMREYIERFPAHRSSMQLNQAKLLLHLQRPRAAIEVLRSMNKETMDGRQQSSWQELVAHAQHQINEGIVELSE